MSIEEKVTRKLRAILSADVKGYSLLMANDEAFTIKTLNAYRNIMSDLIKQHIGRVVDSPGDNVLAEFSSVVDAVTCATEVQKVLKVKNKDLPDDKKLEFRIGVNIGDVVQDGDRIYGNGVNVAARIEGLAEPGGVSISRNAYGQIKDKLTFGYEYIGEHEVKNIKDPIRVYKVLLDPEDSGKLIGEEPRRPRKKWFLPVAVVATIIVTSIVWHFYQKAKKPDIEPASVEGMVLPLPDKPSIAVLAFTNMSGEKEQEYFCDGLSEGIINGLAKSDRLFIIARNSTFIYKGKPVSVKQVAEDLGVRYVLEGSIQKVDDRVRITAQLIDALSGHHLFSERYDRELKDILNLQDEITMKVLTAVQVKLTVGEGALVFAKGTKNLDAYLKVLQAREHKGGIMNKDRVETAIQLLEEAIALDPEYSFAYSILSTAHMDLVALGASDSPRESLRRSIELGNKAVALDESNPYAHANLAFPYMLLGKYDKGILEAEKGVSLSPNYAGGYFALGAVLSAAGRQQEAIPILKKCLRLSPVPVHSQVLGILASSYAALGQFEEAVVTYKKVLHIYGPDQLLAHVGLAIIYAFTNREKEARSEGAEIMRIDPGFSIERYLRSRPYDQSTKDRIAGALRKAGLSDSPPLTGQDKPSIAVLPFENMSGDPEQEYFSDGLTDELIGDLAKISGILVISRNSAFTYKGKQVKISQIAKELNVRYVLEGSIQKFGDKVRIRAQLIDGETDHHLWAESYDGVLKDIFDLQDMITGRIVSALAVTLSSSERERVGDKGTDNIMAYEAFLKGREHFFNLTPKDFVKAIEYYKQAVKFDPDFSRAYAAIGIVYQIGGNLIWSEKMGGDPTTNRLLARKYLELGMINPTFEAYNLYAAKEIHRRNFRESEAFAQKALEYAPNSSEGLRWLAFILVFTGRPEESIEYYHKAIRLDPFDKSLNTPVSNVFIGINHFSMGNLEEAITYLEKGLSLNPKLTNLSSFLAASHALLDHDIEAKKALEEYLKGFPEWLTPTIQMLYGSWPFKDSKVFDRLAQGIVKAGLQGDPKKYYIVIEENKLNGQEIRKLLFGKTSSGYPFGIKELEWVSRISDDGEEEFSIMGKTYIGRAWIENDNICYQREQYQGGLKNCMEVYRNPEGDELSKTEYFEMTDYGLFLCSVE